MRAEDDADFAEKIIVLLSSLEISKMMASKAKEIPDKYFSQVAFERIVKDTILGNPVVRPPKTPDIFQTDRIVI